MQKIQKLARFFVVCLVSMMMFDALATTQVLPDIIASVNDEPITKYELQSRKDIIVALNLIDISNTATNAQLNKLVLNMLIDEEIIRQQAKKLGAAASDAQIDQEIASIETKNNLAKGAIQSIFHEHKLDLSSFRRQMAINLIKNQILFSLSNGITVTPAEIDSYFIDNAVSNLTVDAWLFTTKNDSMSMHKHMEQLKNQLSDCQQLKNMHQTKYQDFADLQKLNTTINNMPASTRSIIYDTKVGNVSSIYKEDHKFKMVMICNKDYATSADDLAQLKSALANKKMTDKISSLFKSWKSQANIKIMVPSYINDLN